jgi:hypothetical protein
VHCDQGNVLTRGHSAEPNLQTAHILYTFAIDSETASRVLDGDRRYAVLIQNELQRADAGRVILLGADGYIVEQMHGGGA